MKFFASTFLLSLLFSVLGLAQSESREITREIAQKAIAVFCADPLSPDSKSAIPLLINFAEKSPEVEINLVPKAVPWFNEEPQPQYASLLLAAYIAGNTKSQLDSGKIKNDSVAGVLQAIATYRQIQKQEPDLIMADVEKLIELNAQNKLKEYLDTP